VEAGVSFPIDSRPYGDGWRAEDSEPTFVGKVGPKGYSHGWIRVGDGTGPHTHETGDLPKKLQVGAFNYKRGKDGNYTRHHPGTGNRAKAFIDKPSYSPEEVKEISRAVDGRGYAGTPVIPISSTKEPKHAPVPGSLFDARPVVEGGE
jgi:hypothetical protein